VQQQVFKVSDVMLEPVWILLLWYARFAHAHVIRQNAALVTRESMDKITVQIAPCRVPVHQHYRLTTAFVHIVHLKGVIIKIVRSKGEGTIKRFVFKRYQVILHLC